MDNMEVEQSQPSLTPKQYQNFRHFVRICRSAFVAMSNSGLPLIDELLPLCSGNPVVLHTLLALASRRDIDHLEATGAPNPYDAALSEVQRHVSSMDDGDLADPLRIQASISTALLLTLLSFSGPSDDWHHHTSRVVSLIDCIELTTMKATRSGNFLLMCAAHLDIPAFSVGKMRSSIHAWRKWGMSNTNWQAARQGQGNQEDSPFLPFEVLTGYPASIVSLIFEASMSADRNSVDSLEPQDQRYTVTADGQPIEERDAEWKLQLDLERWCMPPIPPKMTRIERQALLTGWKTMHKSVMLFHMRRKGFRSNLLVMLPNQLAVGARGLVEDIVIGVKWLLLSWESDQVPMANAMAWPLAVAGCECGVPGLEPMTEDVTWCLDTMMKYFGMKHLAHLKTLLHLVWAQKQRHPDQHQGHFMSLELAANLKQLTVPLF
ncbi:hypothetical protein E8E14_004359 [Neopestalotiopsis sp. 37M]|nr:hypothetical protein E8E14_004359 [Neopestalotiopsis sp. 37M]